MPHTVCCDELLGLMVCYICYNGSAVTLSTDQPHNHHVNFRDKKKHPLIAGRGKSRMDDSDLVTPKPSRARPKATITFSSDEGEEEEGEMAVPCTSLNKFLITVDTLRLCWNLSLSVYLYISSP